MQIFYSHACNVRFGDGIVVHTLVQLCNHTFLAKLKNVVLIDFKVIHLLQSMGIEFILCSACFTLAGMCNHYLQVVTHSVKFGDAI